MCKELTIVELDYTIDSHVPNSTQQPCLVSLEKTNVYNIS